MSRRHLEFGIKAGVILIIATVALVTCAWLTRQMKSSSTPAASQLQVAAAPSGQLEGLKTPLPEVATKSKQETPMAFTEKQKKDPFVADWPVRTREDKKDINVSTEIAGESVGTEAEVSAEEHPDPHALQEEAVELEKPDENSAEGTEEQSDGAASRKEDAEAEHRLPEPEESAHDFVAGDTVDAARDDIPSEVPVRERETVIETQVSKDAAERDAAGPDKIQEDELKPAVDPPRLFVTGIIVSEDASYAIVRTPTSSVIVQPGDEIEGATVKSVQGEAVVVVKQDEEFVLELGGGGES